MKYSSSYTKKGPGRLHKQGKGKDLDKYKLKQYGHFSKNARIVD